MVFFKFKSLSNKLALLVALSVVPALVILLYSGLELRRQSIRNAESKVFQLTHTMAQAQLEVANSARQVLSTLSLLPAVREMDKEASSRIFKEITKNNPSYYNISLSVLDGDVVASARHLQKVNLGDRRHIVEAITKNRFSAGEYMVSRIESTVPSFAFSLPVRDINGKPKAVVSAVIDLASFSSLHDSLKLADRSFVAITDHKGVRIFYYPSQASTNPIGQPIKTRNWEIASKAKEPGIFLSKGSDGLRRIFAFEAVRLSPDDVPFVYVWAGIPENHILGPANAAMTRNLLLMFIVTVIALCVSWLIGTKTETLIDKLENALKEIKTLRGILPICSFCKNIRNDEGYYEQIESYIHKHSDVDFSHTICPECLKKHYPEVARLGREKT